MVSGYKSTTRQVPTDFYVMDDAECAAKCIEDGWDVPDPLLKKPVVQFNSDKDMDSFDYSTGDTQCVIYADEIKATPKGIGFDGYQQTRTVRFTISSMSRESVLKTSDVIGDILAEYGCKPWGEWDLLYLVSDEPVYPFRKFYRRTISYELKTFWKPRTRPKRHQ